MPPNLSVVTISSTSPAVAVRSLLDDSTPTPAGGVGGWEQVARPKRGAMTEWQGHDLYSQSIGLMLDGFASRTSMDVAIANLRRLARAGKGEKHPPIVRLDGPVFGTQLDWVIQDIAWGALERDENTGVVTRQQVTIGLLQYVMPPLKVTKVRAATKPVKTRSVLVRNGDTLGKIAARELKNVKRWKEILACNPGRGLSGNAIPRKLYGKKLRVPVR